MTCYYTSFIITWYGFCQSQQQVLSQFARGSINLTPHNVN